MCESRAGTRYHDCVPGEIQAGRSPRLLPRFIGSVLAVFLLLAPREPQSRIGSKCEYTSVPKSASALWSFNESFTCP